MLVYIWKMSERNLDDLQISGLGDWMVAPFHQDREQNKSSKFKMGNNEFCIGLMDYQKRNISGVGKT